VKYTKGRFKMTREGIHFEAALTPWLRFCIGITILLGGLGMLALAIAPLVKIILWR
jgi:hypothetical protein